MNQIQRIGGGSSVASWSQERQAATLAATNQGDPVCATGLEATPAGRIDLYSPGGQRWTISDGDKTGDIYYSGDGGSNAREQSAIVAGDIEYLGTRGAAAGGTTAGETFVRLY